MKYRVTSVISSPPSAAYMRQSNGSALVQITACRLFGDKPLSKPMLGYCQSDPEDQTSVKFLSKYKTFHSRECIWKSRLRNSGHLVQGRWVNCLSWLQSFALVRQILTLKRIFCHSGTQVVTMTTLSFQWTPNLFRFEKLEIDHKKFVSPIWLATTLQLYIIV